MMLRFGGPLIPALSLLLLVTSTQVTAQQRGYKLPPLELVAFTPIGFRVSLPDSPGVQLFAFHASINKDLAGTEAGTINVDIREKTKGRDGKDYWVYIDTSTKLVPGDKVSYWYWVQHRGLGYQQLENVWRVAQLFDRGTNQVVVTGTTNPATATTVSPPIGGGGGGAQTGTGDGTQNTVQCQKSITTVNGVAACKGRLIFEDNFNSFDLRKWQHEITLSGGRNWEFQLYDNNRTNSYVRNNILVIKPTLTADRLGNDYFLFAGELSLQSGEPGERCTNEYYHGCYKRAFGASIINPVQSARIRTHNSFSFKYGKIEVRAKMPSGDWIHPGIWLAPRFNQYGPWPASGLMMLAEARGNGRLLAADQKRIGVNARVDLGLQFAPFQMPSGRLSTTPNLFGRFNALNPTPDEGGFADEFHTYVMDWTPDNIKFSVDGQEVGKVAPAVKAGGLWNFAQFASRIPGAENPWRFGSKIAPFDQEFYISMGVAVGGIAYFPDDAVNQPAKPWLNTSPNPSYDFWSQKNSWYRSWRPTSNNGEHAALQVDYVKVWSL